MIHQRKILKAIAYAILLCFTSLTGAQPLYAIPANTQLPEGFNNVAGSVNTPVVNGNVMNIHQNSETAVNQWTDFSIGADATVNFTGKVDGFNSLNYVTNGPISEIYGQLTALGGNIFIANPAGVQIGNSAQINVGSLYVTNKDLESEVGAIAKANDAQRIRDIIAAQEAGTAQLMSLGSITSATSVTFDGSRIVLDTDRLFSGESGVGTGEMAKDNIKIFTNDENEVVLGYTSYTTTDPTDTNAGQFGEREYFKITANDNQKEISGYMWVEDLFQLQATNKDLNGWYALRNAIDANYSSEMNFSSIGSAGSSFKGRFDGLDYHIFGLTIGSEDDRQNNVGLFGQVGDGAIIRNVTLNGGSITGDENVGSIAGSVTGSALIENITNTADIDGTNNVGGIIGSLKADGDKKPQAQHFVNSGSVNGTTNVGGIVGEACGITHDG